MNAYDLRLGNYFYDQDGNLDEVTEIVYGEEDYSIKSCYLQSIKLIGRWFEIFGFNYQDGKF